MLSVDSCSKRRRLQTQTRQRSELASLFRAVKESETTKHVHRLHPYKGMFTSQLVEYLLDDHTDGVQDNGMLVAQRHHP